MKRSSYTASFVTVLSISGLAGAAHATSINCPGETIADALNGRAKSIIISGVCAEDVVITKDATELKGDGTVQGSITIDGARNVVIGGLTVEMSSGSGIVLDNAATATIEDATISDNAEDGVVVLNNSLLRLIGSTISNNNAGDTSGVRVNSGGLVRATGNTITAADTEDEENFAVSLAQHGAYVGSGDILANSAGGVAVENGRFSYFEIRDGSEVSGDIGIGRQSHASIRATTVTGDVSAGDNSFVEIRNNSVVDGDLTCMSSSVCTIRHTGSDNSSVGNCQYGGYSIINDAGGKCLD